MDSKAFAVLLSQVDGLSEEQRSTLLQLLSASGPGAQIKALLDGAGSGQPGCPRCGSGRVGSWGTAHGLRRYRCRDCRRSFNVLTGTPLARLRHKKQWLSFTAALQDSLSVRRSAAVCGVADSTAFRWRHRFLQAPAAHESAPLSGIVEADETFFRRSFKGSRAWTNPAPDAPAPARKPRRRGAPTGRRGTPLAEMVPVLIARDRQKATRDGVLPGLTATAIGRVLLPWLAPDALLCTDANHAYGTLARTEGLHHQAVNRSAGEYVRDGVFHIQNVNAYDSRLKTWMHRFHGVATKYLPHYLGWRRMLETLAPTITPAAVLMHCR